MRQTPQEQKITALIEPVVAEKGFELVAVRMLSEDGMQILQIMVEDPATRTIGVDDCSAISRALNALLEVEDPISAAYRLEVSSPGIDRLLTREKDFVDFCGLDTKIEMDMPIDGQKRFRGVTQGIEDGAVIVETEDQGRIALPLSGIAKAKLVMNDELIEAMQKRIKKAV
ncbi:ribosome maturation factor RimP [Micavibrio aeruginosavorus]|uniref:Ribosome maturation factor RimP n=1 Tax=Micavibrio aeruginosavorus EPB TaxID=349215 RepID=M4VFA6_9BACT|nr:ribosome maturation factor RimP [Micavibrio aeruginosavorus]AGH97898.1 transcription termination protein NusA-like protein [Micavibrio aeruginosavorus EPB]